MPASRPSAVTIGAYDGVHLGHRQVIERVRSIASAEGLRSVVVTFDRHPASVVRPHSAPRLLTDLDQKLDLLTATGVDEVVVVHFDDERSNETAEEFVDEVLVDQLASRVVVVGSDFHFGKGRGGNVALLASTGAARGFRVVPFQLVADGRDVVSSTRIRNLIAKGDLRAAGELLGRPHEVRGEVVAQAPAEETGRLALVVPPDILLPPPGTYEVTVSALGGIGAPERTNAVVDGSRSGLHVATAGLSEAPGAGERLRVRFAGSG